MNDNNYLVIMAGGIGSRFWPYSRNNYPKQFLDVLGVGRSLLQLTYDRFLSICKTENVLIVTNDKYAQTVKDQLPDLTDDQILLEPDRRNTAPCIAYAAYKIMSKNPNANLVVSPADHAIFNENVFISTIEKSLRAAEENDWLITIGIQPNRPETGYGYIQYHKDGDREIKKVKTFTEKPHLELAQKFLESGDFVWNSGIFIWSGKAIVKAFELHMRELADLFSAIGPYYYTEKEEAKINHAYAITKGISIDYGVMEKAENVYVMPGQFGWSDLGSWNSLHEIRDKNDENNVIDANALIYDTRSSFIKGPNDKLIVVQGLEDYLVADTGNVLLICKKDQEKMFRTFVGDVKNEKGEEFL